MSKNMKGIMVLLVMGAAVGGLYYFTHKTARTYAKQIVRLGGSSQDVTWLSTLDEGYLKSWAKALTRKDAQFTYNDGTYNSQGGKKIA